MLDRAVGPDPKRGLGPSRPAATEARRGAIGARTTAEARPRLRARWLWDRRAIRAVRSLAARRRRGQRLRRRQALGPLEPSERVIRHPSARCASSATLLPDTRSFAGSAADTPTITEVKRKGPKGPKRSGGKAEPARGVRGKVCVRACVVESNAPDEQMIRAMLDPALPCEAECGATLERECLPLRPGSSPDADGLPGESIGVPISDDRGRC